MENVFIQTAEDFDANESSFEVEEEPEEEFYKNESSFTVKMEVEEDQQVFFSCQGKFEQNFLNPSF